MRCTWHLLLTHPPHPQLHPPSQDNHNFLVYGGSNSSVAVPQYNISDSRQFRYMHEIAVWSLEVRGRGINEMGRSEGMACERESQQALCVHVHSAI